MSNLTLGCHFCWERVGAVPPDLLPAGRELRDELHHRTDADARLKCPAPWSGDMIRMSQLTAAAESTDRTQLSRLSTSIRGKLQFMDYLVRAAVADVERLQDENDPGTRIFIKQLVEMHAANLRLESQNLQMISDLCNMLEAIVSTPAGSNGSGETV
jgi:hypothetical protein